MPLFVAVLHAELFFSIYCCCSCSFPLSYFQFINRKPTKKRKENSLMKQNEKEAASMPTPSSASSASPSSTITENDPMALSRKKVAEAKADTSGRVYNVYCDGVFDLFHVGHALMFKQAKFSLGDPQKVHLIAGVCNDELTLKYKGKVKAKRGKGCRKLCFIYLFIL